ncbi:MAG: hypothetical protein ABII97_03135 [Patescibacteria group bacterium]
MEEENRDLEDVVIITCPSCKKLLMLDKKDIEEGQVVEPCCCGRMVPIFEKRNSNDRKIPKN